MVWRVDRHGRQGQHREDPRYEYAVRCSHHAGGGHAGRALDHVGLDVHGLQALVTKMQEASITVNTPYRTMSLGFLTGISFITDPWGTYIELNEGYDGH